MRVELNEVEVAFCTQIASMRRMMNRGIGVTDMTLKKDFMDGEILGVLGEYAFAKVCNVFPRFIDRVKGGGEDCIFKKNRIDVKATRNPSNGVFVSRKNKDIDIYVLTHVEVGVVNILGWIESGVVTQEKYNVGNGAFRYTGYLNKHKIDWKLKDE